MSGWGCNLEAPPLSEYSCAPLRLFLLTADADGCIFLLRSCRAGVEAAAVAEAGEEVSIGKGAPRELFRGGRWGGRVFSDVWSLVLNLGC